MRWASGSAARLRSREQQAYRTWFNHHREVIHPINPRFTVLKKISFRPGVRDKFNCGASSGLHGEATLPVSRRDQVSTIGSHVKMHNPDAAATAARPTTLPARSLDHLSTELVCLGLAVALLFVAARIAITW